MVNRYEYFKDKIDFYLGKQLFNSGIGYRLYSFGKKRLEINQKLFEFKGKASSDIYNDGYVKFSHNNLELVKDISNKADALLKCKENALYRDSLGKSSDFDHASYLASVNIIRDMPEVLELLNENCMKILYDYYRCHFFPSYVSIYRTRSLDSSKSYETYAHRWHLDKSPSDLCKLFICLSDITDKNGPFHFFSKTYTEFLLKKGYKSRDNYESLPIIYYLNNTSEINKLTGKPSTSCLVNTTACIHRAGIPEKNCERTVCVFTFKSSNRPFRNFDESTKKMIVKNIDMINTGDHSFY